MAEYLLTDEEMEEYLRLKEEEDRRIDEAKRFYARPCWACGRPSEGCNGEEP